MRGLLLTVIVKILLIKLGVRGGDTKFVCLSIELANNEKRQRKIKQRKTEG